MFRSSLINPVLRAPTSLSLCPSTIDLALNVDAWSVAGKTLSSPDFASNLFACSLFPYLGLLYFLSRAETKTPPLGNFGFQFLLVFVFATIPAGIIAKTNYHDILANVDYLHGIAESFLTITNLLIISGFRSPRKRSSTKSSFSFASGWEEPTSLITLTSFVLLLMGAGWWGLEANIEPSNALSLPTWIVHTSSLIEWLAAMKFIWDYASPELADNPRWRGMTWAMVPSHMSGLCACTYHLFYNSPSLLWLVLLQAALTVIGNSTMAIAAFRIYGYEVARQQLPVSAEISYETTQSMPEMASMSTLLMDIPSSSSSSDSEALSAVEEDPSFWTAVCIKSILLAFLVKFGSLYSTISSTHSELSDSALSVAAAAFIVVPTALNVLKWKFRSDDLDQDRKRVYSPEGF